MSEQGFAAFKLPVTLDERMLLRDLAAVADREGLPQPGPYHAGEWKGISIRASGGSASAAPSFPSMLPYGFTDAAASTPYLRKIIEDLPCPVQVVRLLSLPPGGHIKEHVDFFTNFQFGILRLHVPIVTNPRVEFVIAGQRYRLLPGELWYGDYSRPHSVKNDGDTTRIHLVIDVEISASLLSLFPRELVERERIKGISLATEEAALGAEELRRFACTFRVPGRIMPALVLGNMKEMLRGATAEITFENGALTLLLDERPACRLKPLGGSRLGIEGLSSGCYFETTHDDNGICGVTFVIRGAPENLVYARLGRVQGATLPVQEIPLEMVSRARMLSESAGLIPQAVTALGA